MTVITAGTASVLSGGVTGSDNLVSDGGGGNNTGCLSDVLAWNVIVLSIVIHKLNIEQSVKSCSNNFFFMQTFFHSGFAVRAGLCFCRFCRPNRPSHKDESGGGEKIYNQLSSRWPKKYVSRGQNKETDRSPCFSTKEIHFPFCLRPTAKLSSKGYGITLGPLPDFIEMFTKRPPITYYMTNNTNDCATNVLHLSHQHTVTLSRCHTVTQKSI
jgi:hypothetical protein